MKKFLVFCLVAFCFMFVSCNDNDDISTTTPISDSSTSSHNSPTSYTSDTTTITPLPTYKRGSIILGDSEAMSEEAGYPITHRLIWYRISDELIALVGDEFYNSWEIYYRNLRQPGVEPKEMICVTFIKKYGINKADFEKAFEGYQYSLGPISEDEEIPNADIIYTFDDEIINEYYLRK